MNTNENENVKCAVASDCCSARQQGKAVINDIIHRLRRRADDLQIMLDMLPSQPTREQDEALWNVAIGMERV